MSVEDRQPVPVVAAGLLHDLLDDTLTTAEEIEERFGSEVRRLVQAVSEPNKHLSWEERKRMTIQHVHRCSIGNIRSFSKLSIVKDRREWECLFNQLVHDVSSLNKWDPRAFPSFTRV
ncbi:HD domain-containing protein [Acinetobacter soli]